MAYDAPARWETSGPVASIRFYGAAPGAVWYPHPHAFAARSQELQEPQTVLGELTNLGRRRWIPGITPATMRGTHYDITEAQALGQQVYDGPTPGWRVPLCRNPCRVGLACRTRPEPGPALGLTMAANVCWDATVAGPAFGLAMAANVCFDATVFIPLGFTMAANVCYHTWEEMALGLAMDAVIEPGGDTMSMPLGLAMDAVIEPGGDTMSMPLGLAMDAVIGPGDSPMSMPLGLAMGAVIVPGDSPMSMPLGLAMGAVIVTGDGGGGPVTPGASCATAALVGQPFTQTETIPSGAQQWWMFAVTAGAPYHVRFSALSGTNPTCNIWSGDCGTLNFVASVPIPFTLCADFTAPYTGLLLVEVLSGGIGSGTYTIEINGGVC